MSEIYVSTDIETDGPVPGRFIFKVLLFKQAEFCKESR